MDQTDLPAALKARFVSRETRREITSERFDLALKKYKKYFIINFGKKSPEKARRVLNPVKKAPLNVVIKRRIVEVFESLNRQTYLLIFCYSSEDDILWFVLFTIKASSFF